MRSKEEKQPNTGIVKFNDRFDGTLLDFTKENLYSKFYNLDLFNVVDRSKDIKFSWTLNINDFDEND